MNLDRQRTFDDIDEEHFLSILKCLKEKGFISNCIDGNCGTSRYSTIRELPIFFDELCNKFNIDININVDNFYIEIDNDHCMIAYNKNKYNQEELTNILLNR